jgi:hypothetical protein
MMDPRFFQEQLSTQGEAIVQLVQNMDADQAHWKPDAQAWSIVEVINHLIDEEREDFRARIQHLFSGSPGPWPPIAPQAWVRERAYAQRTLPESVELFHQERQNSLAWLRAQASADWAVPYAYAPQKGLTAGDVFVSWAAHDLLHFRQLVELQWAYINTRGLPYSSSYAGEW